MRSIGTKLFLAVLVMIVLLSASLGVFSFYAAKNAIVHQAEANAVRLVTLGGEKLDMKLNLFLNAANPVVSSSDFQKQLLQFSNASGMPEGELQRRIAEVLELMDRLKLSDSSIRDASLLSLADPVPLISTDREAGMPNLRADWIDRIREAGGKPVWLPAKPEGYFGGAPRPLFAYGRLLGKTNIGSNDYILLVQVEYAALQAMLEEVSLGNRSAAYLFGGNEFPEVVAAAGDPADMTSRPLVPGEDTGFRPGVETSVRIEEGHRLAAYRTSPVTGWTLAATVPLDELTGSADRIRAMTFIAVTISIIAAAALGIWMAGIIAKPVRRLKELMRIAAEGDLRVRMQSERKDEIGELSVAFNRMAEQIGQLVSGARRSAEEVEMAGTRVALGARSTAESTEDVCASSALIASGAEELASNAERSGVCVGELSVRVSEAYDLHDRMLASARDAERRCGEGGAVVERLLERAEEIDRQFSRLADKVERLATGATALVEVLQLISGMARRTGILSLNAGIEAARGGENTGGFKVIASEIRRLAEHSDASLRQAGVASDGLRAEVESAVRAMRETALFFPELIGDVRSVYEQFGGIRESMEQVNARLGEANRSLLDLAREHETLRGSIEEVAAVAEEASASTEQVAERISEQKRIGAEMIELSEQLKRLSERLAQQMSGFLI